MNNEYIGIEDCRHGALYRIDARNFSFGIYDEYTQSFTGIRTKFGMQSLFPEIHWDTGPPYGTAKPLEFLEQSPFVDSNLRYIYINNKDYYFEIKNWLFSKIDEYGEGE